MYLDKLSIKEIIKLTKTNNIRLIFKNKVSSTNEILKGYAKKGENEGLVIIAEAQTKGYGRFERKFYSPKGNGIYMSILLKPKFKGEDSVLITACAAIAVARAIEELSEKTTKIKWVNDIYIDSKKVCGILTEGSINSQNNNFDWAILGIGINVYTPKGDFDKSIKNIAGSIFENKERNLRNRLCALVIDNFFKYYNELKTKSFFSEYKKRIMYIGEKINIYHLNEIISATLLDLNEDCTLKVKYDDGLIKNICSGEISIRSEN